MVDIDSFRQIALSLPDTVELPHFEKTSFRVKKKIFATLDEKNNRACLMLTPEDQSVFIVFNKAIIYPVPNKWGLKGATYVELKLVSKTMLKDAMMQAYHKATAQKSRTNL